MNKSYQQVGQTDREFSPYGNSIVVCNSTGEPKCMLGPHYYVFISAFIALSFLFIYMFTKAAEQLTVAWRIAILCCIAIFMISYLLVGFSNPGIIPKNSQYSPDCNQEAPNRSFCAHCKINRPYRTVHCTSCNSCIRIHDHHCVWIGKCAGENNICLFYLFVTSTFSTFVVFFIGALSSNVIGNN